MLCSSLIFKRDYAKVHHVKQKTSKAVEGLKLPQEKLTSRSRMLSQVFRVLLRIIFILKKFLGFRTEWNEAGKASSDHIYYRKAEFLNKIYLAKLFYSPNFMWPSKPLPSSLLVITSLMYSAPFSLTSFIWVHNSSVPLWSHIPHSSLSAFKWPIRVQNIHLYDMATAQTYAISPQWYHKHWL